MTRNIAPSIAIAAIVILTASGSAQAGDGNYFMWSPGAYGDKAKSSNDSAGRSQSSKSKHKCLNAEAGKGVKQTTKIPQFAINGN